MEEMSRRRRMERSRGILPQSYICGGPVESRRRAFPDPLLKSNDGSFVDLIVVMKGRRVFPTDLAPMADGNGYRLRQRSPMKAW